MDMNMGNKKYRVVHITNNLDKHPECKKDTKSYQHLVEHVEDETELFVIDINDVTNYYKADEFFYMEHIREFEVKYYD